ncbi:MAG: formate dehydrogenase accessory sulfurtransferase FdhD [Paracoccus sp. (in: a-proteobacteria)]|uniref:formate dehydrogenase accessory sulfurtransferase FdhD n=1 Tax=Paracoccus sp. TaxID=267 RepID=UPI0026E08883|nr:formate dehydrogenase accessory sulfurtransferase FdhD [Paracoccus sp. (in: a-proteobacteria)]MDO5612376.1 formate dehydrogenase accessory sulfurtransferase FdhD [Paracoccus sp. (in: a-proteobacteria)]MDO5633013.1 formate dehydrogenase accessory sulfurtransferase FdhD [Paracoccus sp. (in: a-proteobacteria)]
MEDHAAASAQPAAPRRWQDGAWITGDAPPPPAESPVAIVIDGQSQAVLMATPADLHDLAVGFALTEGMIASAADVQSFEQVAVETRGLPGAEARLWLRPGIAAALSERRRKMLGPVGCGLCGIDSIEQALPELLPVTSALRITPADIQAAMAALSAGQIRWRQTPAIHGACFWHPAAAPTVREDVGRHNALDKVSGALARDGRTGAGGVIAMTSRLSVDLVQKAARMQAAVVIGASAPTTLAITWAQAAGITLIGRARGTGFDLYTHPERLKG